MIPQPCEISWCRGLHREPPGAPRYHWLDAGTIDGRDFVLGVVIQQFGEEPPHVRVFTAEGTYVDVSGEVAAVIGRIITGMDPEPLQEAGQAFTAASAALLGGER